MAKKKKDIENPKDTKKGQKLDDKKKVEAEVDEQLEKLTDELEMAKEEVTEMKDKYLRLYAEFDNFRKRTAKEKLELRETAAENVLRTMLDVLDDFDRAKQESEKEGSKEPMSEGVNMIYHKLYKIVEQHGVKPMVSTGELFDPEYHEAITEIPAPSKKMKNKVVDTIEKGYFLGEKILRYAKVVVGK